MADAHSKPVWFITGCSTGFGRELSLLLLKRGYRVVATARDKAKIDDIVAGHEKNGLALRLDVDKQDQIEAAVKAAETRFGRIDVLVNNAGYGYLAAVEEGDDADIRAMFETNFFGLAAMTRAVLPTMRAQKSGAIVNISSSVDSSVSPGRVTTRRRSSPSKVCRNRCRRKSGRSESRSLSSSQARSAPTGPAVRSKTPKHPIDAYADTAHARRRQLQGDQRQASRAIPCASRGDHRRG